MRRCPYETAGQQERNLSAFAHGGSSGNGGGLPGAVLVVVIVNLAQVAFLRL